MKYIPHLDYWYYLLPYERLAVKRLALPRRFYAPIGNRLTHEGGRGFHSQKANLSLEVFAQLDAAVIMA